MTDNDIIKALECCKMPVGSGACKSCPLNEIRTNRRIDDESCTSIFLKNALDLINRQKAEIEELAYKLECLLCHATSGKLSKYTYPLDTMERYVNDTIQEYCEEAQAEAIKEFAERLKQVLYNDEYILIRSIIDNLVKEMVGDA